MTRAITSRSARLPYVLFALLIVLLLSNFSFTNHVMAQGSGPAKVDIQKSASVSSVPTGQNFIYTLLYSCASITGQCNNVVVTDQLPPEVEFVSSLGSVHTQNNGQYNAANRTVTFAFKDPLPAGSTGDLKITVRFPNGATPNGTVATNTAQITPSNGAPATSNPVNVTATAQANATITKTGPTTGYLSNGTQNFDATYTMQLCTGSGAGSLGLNNVQMVDTLPAGVQFVSATGTFTHNGNTVTWSLGNLAANQCVSQNVTIRFPTGAFTVGSKVTNSVSASGQPSGQTGTVTIGPGTATTTIANFTPTPSGGLTKSVSAGFSVGAEANYKLNPQNTGNVALNQFIVTDNIPPQFNVTRLTTGKFTNATGVTYVVRYRTNSTPANTWVDWATVADPTKTQTLSVATLNLPAGAYIAAVQLDFGTVPVGFGASTAPAIFGLVITPDHNGTPVVAGNKVQNCGSLTWQGAATPVTSCKTSTVTALTARPVPEKIITGTVEPYLPGSLVGYRLRVTNDVASTGPMVNPVIADLLPTSLEYVDNSWSYTAGTSAAPAPTFEKIDNYDNSGRTLLRWKWTASFAVNTNAFVSFQVRIKTTAQPGTLVNSYDLTTNDTPFQCKGGAGTRADVNDVDGDGNRAELLCYADVSLILQPTATLDSIKWVKGQLDADYSKFPDSGFTVPGGAADYRVIVKNSGNVSMTNISIVDILPFVGDTGVRDLSPRLTAWRPNLIGLVSAPTGVTVYYSTAHNPCRPELAPGGPAGCEAPNWSTVPPSDMSTVQSLKFDFGSIIVGPGDELQLEWPMRAPLTAPTNGEIAWNSFAYIATRTDTGATLLAAEPNKVGIAVQALKPAGYGDFVWNDLNHDGIQDANEAGINGVRVELYQPGNDGLACTTDDQFVGFTATSDGGQYIFSNLQPGNYFAVFYPPPTYVVSPHDVGADDSHDSDGVPGSCNGFDAAITPITQLDATELDRTWDLGLYQQPPVAAVGNYVWFDANGNGVQDEPTTNGVNGVKVELHASSGALINTTVTTNDVSGNPGYYLFDKLTPGDYYLVFTAPISSTFTSQDQGGNDLSDSDVDTTGKTVTFTLVDGQYDPSRDAGIIRELGALSLGDLVWLDANNNSLYELQNNEAGINGVKVNLLVDVDHNGVCTPGVDGFYATTTTATHNGQPGYYLFSNLLEGDYIVQIDPANFTANGVLHNLASSGDSTVAPAPNNNINNDDNGTPVTNCGIASGAVTLTTGAEPVDDGDSAANSNLTVDFGFYQPILGSLGDRVWLDANGDGVQDVGETGIVGVQMILTNSSGVTQTTTTGTDGIYHFIDLPADAYQVMVNPATLPPSLAQTYDLDGLATPHTAMAALAAGQNRTDVDFGYQPSVLGCIGDTVWLDTNGNGVQDNGEQGIGSVQMILSNSQGVTQTLTTDNVGHYLFCQLPADTYTVRVNPNTLPPNVTQTYDLDGLATPHTATAPLTAGQTRLDVDFGYQPPTLGCIGDTVWLDNNGDGLLNPGEPGISSVQLILSNSQGVTQTISTDVDGHYLVCQLPADTYTVRVNPNTLPPNVTQTYDLDGLATPHTATAPLATGQTRLDVDFGYQPPTLGCIGDTVWLDVNGDGSQSSDEQGIAGVQVILTDSQGVTQTLTTTSVGHYLFCDLPAGSYTVQVNPATLPTNLTQTYDLDGLATPHTATATLATGQTRLDVDFGYQPPAAILACIGDFVWLDVNADGIQDTGENGVAGETATLYDSTGNVVLTTTTDANGQYSFCNLLPGDYAVGFTPPGNSFVISPPARGGDAAKDSDANETTGRATVTTLSPGEKDMTWDMGMYAPPELFIQKSANLTLVQPGNTILYTLVYSNTGKGVATGVVITETVPAHTSFAPAASTPNWVCAGNQVKAGTRCTFNVGTLAAGASGKITFATVVDAILLEDATVVNNVVVMLDDKKHGATPGGQSSSQVNIPIFRPTGLETTPEPKAPTAGHNIFLPQVKR